MWTRVVGGDTGVDRFAADWLWLKLKIKTLETPVLHISIHMASLVGVCILTRLLQQLFCFGVVDAFNLLIIEEVLLFTLMLDDLERPRVQDVLRLIATDNGGIQSCVGSAGLAYVSALPT